MKKIIIVIFFLSTEFTQAQISNISIEDKKILCNYGNFLNKASSSEEKALREELYLQLIGVLEILSAYRQDFLLKGNLIDLFPTAYYHTTMSEMKYIVANDFLYPIEKMKQLLAFFDAYQRNRRLWESNNSAKVELHWQKHFYEASSGFSNNINLLCLGLGCLKSGIIAHVEYDLPRAIRYAFNHRYNNALNEINLIGDFNKTDRVFATTKEKTKTDVATIRNCSVWWQTVGDKLIGLDVISLRKEAWKRAFSKSPITGIDGYEMLDQPFSNHQELLNKGKSICDIQTNITLFLFDVSGSMNENNKWAGAKQAATSTLDFLFDEAGKNNKTPAVGLMSYSGACVDNPTTKILDFSSDKAIIKDAINNNLPHPNGSTPTPQAIRNAEAFLKQQLEKNNQCEGDLIILTDGQSTCGSMRPPGIYSLQITSTVYSSCQPGSGNFQMRYQTIGFAIPPGSEAEKDMQYLASTHGGRYFHADNVAELKKAFEKISRVFVPIETMQSTLAAASIDKSKFNAGVELVKARNYDTTFSIFKKLNEKYPNDSASLYNYALMSEATDQYKLAANNYSKYLEQNPQVYNRKDIEITIQKMNDYYLEYFAYQKEIVKKDLAFLNEHFQKLMNGQSIPLANEFTGFIREKSEQYKKLPSILGSNNQQIINLCNEIVASFKTAQRRITNNAKGWDQDAVPVISVLYLKLEKLATLIEPVQPN